MPRGHWSVPGVRPDSLPPSRVPFQERARAPIPRPFGVSASQCVLALSLGFCIYTWPLKQDLSVALASWIAWGLQTSLDSRSTALLTCTGGDMAEFHIVGEKPTAPTCLWLGDEQS